MPTISVDQDLLRRFVEQRGRKHDVEDLAFRLPLMGTDIDTCNEDVLDIEIFPDRPDLLSPETLFHGMMPFILPMPFQRSKDSKPAMKSMEMSYAGRVVWIVWGIAFQPRQNGSLLHLDMWVILKWKTRMRENYILGMVLLLEMEIKRIKEKFWQTSKKEEGTIWVSLGI